MKQIRSTSFWKKKKVSVMVRLSGCVCVIAMAFGMSFCAFAGNTLDLSITVEKGTCEFTLPPKVDLGTVIPSDFVNNGGTARIRHFALTLNKCVGPTGGQDTAGIVLSGTTLASDNQLSIFNDDSSGISGFLFSEGEYGGSLTNFKKTTNLVKQGVASQKSMFEKGKLPKDGTVVPYSVGFVAPDNITPTVGTVSATVTFQMSYN